MRVQVTFFDDERMEGLAKDLTFDELDFLLDVDDTSGIENNETAWIPLSAVKVVELPTQEEPPGEAPLRKVAIRFLDGEVIRGHIDGVLERHRYGLILHLYGESSQDPARRLGIPFSAVKALFYLKEFDSRGADAAGMPSDAYLARRTIAPLLGVLEEMDMLSRLHEGGVLSDDEFQVKRTSVMERL
ncbi:MAG: hypothetical protein ACREPI_00565 [Candidatus Dormibacterales bacterium]